MYQSRPKRILKFLPSSGRRQPERKGNARARISPRPELLDTLTAFLPLLPNYTGIPADNIKWAEIAGGNFEYTKGGAVTLSLGVAVVIKGVGGYTFKSPELTVDLEHADINTAEDWRDKYSALAKFLHDEIIYYAEGKRAQGTLFEPQEGEENPQPVAE